MRRKSSKARRRAKLVNECLKLAYSSLESHYGYTTWSLKTKEARKTNGSEWFHKKTIREYAWFMFLLSQLY